MSEISSTLTNPVEAASVFARYYNSERYFEDLARWFNIETGFTPGGYVIKLVPVRKNEKGFRLGMREHLEIEDYCFSVTTLYYSLIPQAIASVLDNASMYRFHRASGLPMLMSEQNDLMAPGQTLKEAGLFPSDEIIDIYSAFAYNVRDFMRRELDDFFSGTQAADMLDSDAYHILCGSMMGKLDEVWRSIEAEMDRTFLPDQGNLSHPLHFVTTPIGDDIRKQSLQEAEMLYQKQVQAVETQTIMSTAPHTTSRKRNPLKLNPKISEILDKWNEGMRRLYFVSGDFSVQLMMGLYAIQPGHDMEVLALMGSHQHLNRDLNTILSPDDIRQLRHAYIAVANHCFSRAYHPSIIPNKAFDALVYFLDAQPGMKVFNPYFSSQSFVYRLTSNGCHCEAFEMGAIRWGMSRIYLDARNQLFNSAEMPRMATYATSIEEIGRNSKYDRIVAYVKDADQENFDDTLKQWVLHCLNPDGLVAVLLPEEANVATDRWRMLRRHLVEKGMLRGVVRLPDDKGSYTIWLVGHPADITPFFFNYAAYADLLEFREEQCQAAFDDESQCLRVPINKLKNTNYSFHPQRHLPLFVEEENKVQSTLGKLLELKPCDEVEEGSGLWVGLSSNKGLQAAYSTNPLDCTVTSDRIREKDFTNAVVVPQPSLLAIDHKGEMRVARVTSDLDTEGRKLHAAGRAFVFQTRSQTRCSEDYLLWLITQPSTNEQVRVMSVMKCRESSMQLRYCKSLLLPDDFKAIRVQLPPLTEQLRILESDRRGHLAQMASEQGERFQAMEHDLAVKRHSIGQTLFRTSNWLQVLMSMREQSQGVLRDTDTLEGLPYTVGDIFNELEHAIQQLAQKVETLRGDTHSECQLFDIKSQVEKFIDDHHYDVCTLLKDWRDDVDTDLMVNFPPSAFNQILENILSNAVSHGFGNRRRTEGNRVLFSTQIVDGNRAQLTVANNGVRISAKMERMDPFEYGTTIKPEPDSEHLRLSSNEVHSGIGGYQIRQLMERYGGEVFFDSTPDEVYKVSYRLVFNLANKR